MQGNGTGPWWAPNQKKPLKSGLFPESQAQSASGVRPSSAVQTFVSRFSLAILGWVLAVLGGVMLSSGIGALPTAGGVLFLLLGVVIGLAGFAAVMAHTGALISYLDPRRQKESDIKNAVGLMQGDVQPIEARKGLMAPEMILHQFVQQTRAYATEKSFQKGRQERQAGVAVGADSADLLKRRWNEVVDSLNEFEIYLANDAQGMIGKFVAKHPSQHMDVSGIFRDVAESFDTTWRRKGINIESAIVTPLKATTNEPLLRRLLVGPWRSTAYFARRGGGVVFSAKSVDSQVVARWECGGMSIPEDYLEWARRSDIPVNERIEKGMGLLAPDPNSPNTLFALVSFIIWLDLANAAKADYKMKNNNEGLVIELRLSK